MFTMVGGLIFSGCSNTALMPKTAEELYFPQQSLCEKIDIVIGILGLILGAIMFSTQSYTASIVLFSMGSISLPIIVGNICGLIKRCRLDALTHRADVIIARSHHVVEK